MIISFRKRHEPSHAAMAGPNQIAAKGRNPIGRKPLSMMRPALAPPRSPGLAFTPRLHPPPGQAGRLIHIPRARILVISSA